MKDGNSILDGNLDSGLEVVNIDDFLLSLREMTVSELSTLVNMCNQVIADKTSELDYKTS